MTTRGSNVCSTSLKQSIENGDLVAVRSLVEEGGEDIRLLFLDGSSPLGVAIANQREDVAAFLLDAGANPVAADSFRLDGCERQPVHYASSSGMLPVLKRLLLEGAEIDDMDYGESTPLHYAAERGHTAVIEFLLSEGCEIDRVSSSGHTPLGRAALGGHRQALHVLEDVQLNIVKDLLYFGADLHSVDIEGNTALHAAACFGRTEAAQFLIQERVDIAKKNDYGNRALHNSTMHGHVECSVLLLNHGARFNVKNHRGQSPLYCSMLHQQEHTVNLLHDLGARLTASENVMYERYEASRKTEKRDFYHWTNSLSQVTPSLKSLSRIVIRAAVKTPLSLSILQLPVPAACQGYLLLSDYITDS
ncbi:hypothetical protein CAPTEDRAFT_150764, partial [Capitella teleta]